MNLLLRPIAGTGRLAIDLWSKFGDFLLHIRRVGSLVPATVARMPLFVKNLNISMEQMYQIGVESIPLVSITALFLGAETVIQTKYQFRDLVPLKYLGVAVCKAIINELGPVVTSLVISGRVATAIAAEIGSMKTSEQLDAMTILSLDPVRYLIVPKTIACVIMVPVLVVWAELVAIIGSIITVVLALDVTLYVYLNGLRQFFVATDLLAGVLKTSVFGFVIAMTGAYYGLIARGGAEGVGNATTRAVMTSAVLILIFDFMVASLLW